MRFPTFLPTYLQAGFPKKITNRENAELIIEEYYEMAAEHEQIANWLEEYKEMRETNFNYTEMLDARYEQGKADATKWIPCKEKLPEKGKYLVCGESGIITTLTYEEGWNCYRGYNDEIVRDKEITDIVAWMELPERYKDE